MTSYFSPTVPKISFSDLEFLNALFIQRGYECDYIKWVLPDGGLEASVRGAPFRLEVESLSGIADLDARISRAHGAFFLYVGCVFPGDCERHHRDRRHFLCTFGRPSTEAEIGISLSAYGLAYGVGFNDDPRAISYVKDIEAFSIGMMNHFGFKYAEMIDEEGEMRCTYSLGEQFPSEPDTWPF